MQQAAQIQAAHLWSGEDFVLSAMLGEALWLMSSAISVGCLLACTNFTFRTLGRQELTKPAVSSAARCWGAMLQG